MIILVLFSILFISRVNNYISELKTKIEALESEIDILQTEVVPEEIINDVPKEVEHKNSGTFKLTAYCACEKCCGVWATKNKGITASGTKATEGRTIAVYTKQIPFGTEVQIEGLGTYIAEDTGSAIKENCIDVFFKDHNEALKFGVQHKEVKWGDINVY